MWLAIMSSTSIPLPLQNFCNSGLKGIKRCLSLTRGLSIVEMKANNQLAISLPVLVCQNMGRYNAKSLSTKLGLKLTGLCWTHFTTETVRRGLDFCGYSREHM